METSNMEFLSIEELSIIKGGQWVIIDGELYWVDELLETEYNNMYV